MTRRFLKRLARGCRRRAFTLIELLTVMAIVGILAGILLPVVAVARERARRVACFGNLDQVGKALAFYVQTYSEYLPCWPGYGLRSTAFSDGGESVANYAEHQGVSRHMVIGYGAEETSPQQDLTPGRLNFMPVGLGYLAERGDLAPECLACPSMKGRPATYYGNAAYSFDSAFPRCFQRAKDAPLTRADGRGLPHTATSGGKLVTAILSSYSYRDTPFYSRLKPANAVSDWTYAADYPNLADHAYANSPWLAEWKLEKVKPVRKVQFMTPAFRTMKQLDSRAIAADSFDYASPSSGFSGESFVYMHHRDGCNVLYGDGHASWFEDDAKRLRRFDLWADTSNTGTDNLTIASASSQRAWNVLDVAAGMDKE